MVDPRDEEFNCHYGHRGPAVPDLPTSDAFRQPIPVLGVGLAAAARSTYGGRSISFVANLCAEVSVFAAAACAIAFAVWGQDPGAQAATPPAARAAVRALWYVPPIRDMGAAVHLASRQVGRQGGRTSQPRTDAD